MRRDLRARTLAGLVFVTALSGCTTVQLRRTTINQVSTVHDIYQQQVLDNLAMFVHNRGSYPYFSLIGTGTTTLTDTATLADTNGWARNAAGSLVYATAGLNPSVMRAKMGSWATFPINDSVKLTVMRCVYQAALDGCLSAPGESCPDCANLFYAYYNMEPPNPSKSIPYHDGPANDPLDPSNTPSYSGTATFAAGGKSTVCTGLPFTAQDAFKGFTLRFGADEYTVESSKSNGAATNPTTDLVVNRELTDTYTGKTYDLRDKIRLPIRGIVTPECLAFQQGWFCHGPALPKHLEKCTPCGYYCGTYVWVPAAGVDQLTRLVLLIQDLAYYDPPVAGTQVVTTEKTKDFPGAQTKAKLNGDLRILELAANKKLDPESKIEPKAFQADIQSKIEALKKSISQIDEGAPAATTTTTILRTRPTRQPSLFQPSILQLQQGLNLLPGGR